jgi:hypothetical protein
MNRYIDVDGANVIAIQLTGPCVVNSRLGERVGDAGDWLLELPNGWPFIMDDAAFTASFTLI